MAFDDCASSLQDPEAILGSDVLHIGTTAEGCRVYRPHNAAAAHILRELGFRFGTHRVAGGYARGWK